MSSFNLKRSIALAQQGKMQGVKNTSYQKHIGNESTSITYNQGRFLSDIYTIGNEALFSIGSNNQNEIPKDWDMVFAYFFDVNKWYADLLLPNTERYKIEEYNKKKLPLEDLLKDDVFVLNAMIISNIENIPNMVAIRQLETYINNKQSVITSPFKKTLNTVSSAYRMANEALKAFIIKDKDGKYTLTDTANEYKTSSIRDMKIQDKDILAVLNAIKSKGMGIVVDDEGMFPVFKNIHDSLFIQETLEEIAKEQEDSKAPEINIEKIQQMATTGMDTIQQGIGVYNQFSSVVQSAEVAKGAFGWLSTTLGSLKGSILGKLTSIMGFFSNMKASIGKLASSFGGHVMKHANMRNGIILVGVIIVISGAIWVGKVYADRKKALKELFSTIDEVDKKIKQLKNIHNPKSRLSIEQVADICNGIGSLLLYTKSVLGVSEYINSVNLSNFEKELERTYNLLSNNNLDNDKMLDAIVRLNIAFNPVNGEVIKILNEVQKEVLNESIPTINGSRVIISSLVNGIIGYNVYFDNGILKSTPFMIVEKSSTKVANILEEATTNELQQVADAVRGIIKLDNNAKKTLEKIGAKYTIQPNNNASLVIATAMMTVNDYYGVLPKNATSISNILNMYLSTIQQ